MLRIEKKPGETPNNDLTQATRSRKRILTAWNRSLDVPLVNNV